MSWKEIYYINLYANDFTTNKSGLYSGGVTDLHLDDNWILYSKNFIKYIFDKKIVIQNQHLLFNREIISKIPLIHIIENSKLNSTGKCKYDLSQKWFCDSSNKKGIITLKKNTTNYFRNICNAKSIQCMWTTFDEVVPFIKGKGFTKGFTSLNDTYFTNCKYLAFLCNLFYPANVSIENISENNYALSEMLQFIWRSAIRDGNEIWVYIPSIRMRNLFKQWIKQNSK